MKQMSQTNDLLGEISVKLDKILKLLALDTVKGLSTEQEKIELLDSLGFRPSEIAKFLNKSPENVSVQLNIIRKKKEKVPKTPTKPVAMQEGTKKESTEKPETPK
jgi:DNA-binding NarL/FixJ family response regulator